MESWSRRNFPLEILAHVPPVDDKRKRVAGDATAKGR